VSTLVKFWKPTPIVLASPAVQVLHPACYRPRHPEAVAEEAARFKTMDNGQPSARQPLRRGHGCSCGRCPISRGAATWWRHESRNEKSGTAAALSS